MKHAKINFILENMQRIAIDFMGRQASKIGDFFGAIRDLIGPDNQQFIAWDGSNDTFVVARPARETSLKCIQAKPPERFLFGRMGEPIGAEAKISELPPQWRRIREAQRVVDE